MSERDDLAILGEACEWLSWYGGALASVTLVRDAVSVARAHGWTPTRRSIEEKARRQVDALRAALTPEALCATCMHERGEHDEFCAIEGCMCDLFVVAPPRLDAQRVSDADIPRIERAARAWRASSLDERAALREAFARVFAKLAPVDLADMTDFIGEIAGCAMTQRAGHPLRIFATTETAFTAKRALREKLGALLDLAKAYTAAQTPENEKAINDWIAANEPAIEEARRLAR